MIPLILIDDHPLTRGGIRDQLEKTGRFTVAGEAAGLEQARPLLESAEPPPALLILDISLGAENGLDFIGEIQDAFRKRKTRPPAILVCSMYDDPFVARNALASGADGYICKSAEPGEFAAAVDAVLAGKTYTGKSVELPAQNQSWEALTRRESEIVTLLKCSFTNKQIAKSMGINVRTVENHLSHIYEKTGIPTRRGLANL
jgi:NarL family two-component system response regulator LiaR